MCTHTTQRHIYTIHMCTYILPMCPHYTCLYKPIHTTHMCTHSTHNNMHMRTHTFSYKYNHFHRTLDSKGLSQTTRSEFQICVDPPTPEKLKLADLGYQGTAPKNQTELFQTKFPSPRSTEERSREGQKFLKLTQSRSD